MSERSRASINLLSASCPGGMARQFRVQVKSDDTPSHWKLAGSFTNLPQASACAKRLESAGEKIRVLDCRALPTAA